MTEKEIAELHQRIERRNFVLDGSLFGELIKAKLARLQPLHPVANSATKLQKTQG